MKGAAARPAAALLSAGSTVASGWASEGGANALVLAVAQGLFTAAAAIDLTFTGLTGYQLAPDKSLATLPFALITVAGAITTPFASLLMQHAGRRWGFVIGASTCAAGGAVSVWAVLQGSFWTFCLGTASVGVFQAFAQYYRLAAADAVGAHDKARAISVVLGGGVIAAVLGPALAAWSKDLLPALFAGSYLMVSALGLASALLIGLAYRDADDPRLTRDAVPGPVRPLGTVLRQPIARAALANNAIGGVTMMFVMTAAPLAAVACRHTIDDGASIIQWHLVGMFAPSFFAGRLIAMFGLPALLFSGMALTAACGVIAMASTSLAAFYLALLCLGVGWNFMYVGGTALLASSHLPEERGRVQGIAESVGYAFSAVATLAAGPALERFGWSGANAATFPLLVVAAVMTLAWMRADRGAVSVMGS